MNILENNKILLVEDQILIGTHQKMELEQRAYQVTHVYSGEKALEVLFGKEDSFDLILMDIDLGPGADGIDTAQKILSKIHIPIIFLSSHTDPEIVAKTEQVSSYGYVTKNSGITVLDASIKVAFRLYEAKENEKRARRQAELALIVRENSIDQLIDHMLDGFALVEPVLTQNGQVEDLLYLRVNPAVTKITGVSETDYLSNTAKQLFNDKAQEEFFEKHEQVLKSGIPLRFIEYFSLLNHWYEISIYKMNHKRLAVFFHDISERILSQKALAASETKYRSLFNHTPQEIHFWKLVRNEAGDIETWQLVDANPAALKGWGKSHEETVGKIADEVFPGNKPTEQFMPIVQKIFNEGKPHSWEMFFEAANQHLFMTSVPFGEYFVTTGIDITDNILLKKQLKEKEALVKEVLHRVKNHLASLVSLLSLQADSITSPEALNAIHESTSRIKLMSKIYEKLLRSDNFQDVKIKNYLEDLAFSIITLMSEKGTIKLDLKIDDFILEESMIFPLGAIINELITNSIKHGFSEQEGGEIKLQLSKKESKVTLNYQDNGKGLPEDFDKNNAGLGLMLINLFTQQMKTTYHLNSDNGFQCIISFKI